jgi:hypothetical protein
VKLLINEGHRPEVPIESTRLFWRFYLENADKPLEAGDSTRRARPSPKKRWINGWLAVSPFPFRER